MRNQAHDVPQLLSPLRLHLVLSVSSLSVFLLSWKSSTMSLSLLQNPDSWKVHKTMRIWAFQTVLLVAYTVFLILIIPAFSILRAAVQVLSLGSFSRWAGSPSSRKCPVHPDLLLSACCQLFLGTLPPIPLQCFTINLSYIRSHISHNFYIYNHVTFKCFLGMFLPIIAF